MALTPAQRAEISRNNGRRSQGPKTERGKRSASRNSYKHGCCATVATLLNEDPAAVAARQAAWEDYYQPDSPATHHLVNECIRSTLLADRCQRRHDAAIAEQVEEAAKRFDHARRKEVKLLADHLINDPAAAVEGLRRLGHGCRWMIARWERLDRVLTSEGCWDEPEFHEAARLLGVNPDLGHCNRHARTYLMMLCNLQIQPESYAELIAQLLTPEYLPAELEGVDRSEWYPAPEQSREHLHRLVAAELAALHATERRVRTEEDDPERDRLMDLALTLEDETEARLFFRYRGEARSTFHRAYKELVGAMKREEESGSRNEPEPAVEAEKDQEVTADASGCATGTLGPSSAPGGADLGAEDGPQAPQDRIEPEASDPERSDAPESDVEVVAVPDPGTRDEARSVSRNEPAPASEIEEGNKVIAATGCDSGPVRASHEDHGAGLAGPSGGTIAPMRARVAFSGGLPPVDFRLAGRTAIVRQAPN